MKNVRVWFEKKDECRFISHLDLNRVMLRAVQKNRLPIWHTEGFNPHPFITFALPLSLGFIGKKETMDMKLLDEEMPFDDIINAFNSCLPKGLYVYKVTEPIMKPGKINYAHFEIELSDKNNDILFENVNSLFAMDEIMIDKKSKSGIKEVDLKENFCKYEISKSESGVNISILLPAGSNTNVNPNLICKALEKYFNQKPLARITRTEIYNEEVVPFE